MSISIPSRKVEWSSNGSSWNDVSADVEQIELVQREITAGTSTADIVLNNLAGKYVSTLFPPWETEQGLYYFWRITLNGKGPWYGRATDLEVNLEGSPPKETLRVPIALHDERLKNYYLTGLISNTFLERMIQSAISQYPPLNGYANMLDGSSGLFTITPSPLGGGTAPKFGSDYDCKNRPFIHDFIRDLLTTVGWAGYVDSTVAYNAATIKIFSVGTNTYASSITYATNVNSVKNPRSIIQTKNVVEFVGGLANKEPPDGDAWTEASTFGWSPLPNSNTAISTDSFHECVTKNADGTCTDSKSIKLSSTSGIRASLSLETVLGETFNAKKRNSMMLTFYWNAIGISPILFPTILRVELQDLSGNRIYYNAIAPSGPFLNFIQSSRSVPGSIKKPPTSADWAARNDSDLGFDWGNIKAINFTDESSPGTLAQSIWIDHLYFSQNYQPHFTLTDFDSVGKYTERMGYYDASQFTTDLALNAFAQQKLNKLSPPLFALDVTTTLSPDMEANGFQPGYVFPAGNVAIARYGLDKHGWRAIEVRTLLDAGKLWTTFRLTPADGPSVGVDMSKFDARRWWAYPFRYMT